MQSDSWEISSLFSHASIFMICLLNSAVRMFRDLGNYVRSCGLYLWTDFIIRFNIKILRGLRFGLEVLNGTLIIDLFLKGYYAPDGLSCRWKWRTLIFVTFKYSISLAFTKLFFYEKVCLIYDWLVGLVVRYPEW